MSDVGIPLSQQSAYQRWEMSSFTADKKVFNDVNKRDFADDEKSFADAKVSAHFKVAFENARKEGYIKGMQEGLAASLNQAEELIANEKETFIKLLTSLSNAFNDTDKIVANQVMMLALDVAKAMLKTELHVNQEAILPIVQDSLKSLLINQKPARILLSRADALIVNKHLSGELIEHDWHIVEDARLENGDCFIETDSNQLDSTNSMRWKKICEALSQPNVWSEDK